VWSPLFFCAKLLFCARALNKRADLNNEACTTSTIPHRQKAEADRRPHAGQRAL